MFDFAWLFNRDKLTINASHRDIFLKHIQPEEYNPEQKNEDKTKFVEKLNQLIKKRSHIDKELMQTIPNQLEEFDRIKTGMYQNNNYFLDVIDLENIKLTGKNLGHLISVLKKYTENISQNIQSCQNDEENKQIWERQSIRILKFMPIVKKLVRIFQSIIICKRSNKEHSFKLTLHDVYKLAESSADIKKAEQYALLGGTLEQIIDYSKSNVEVEIVSQYCAQDFSLESSYKNAKSDISPQIVQSFIVLGVNQVDAVRLTQDDYDPKQTQKFIQHGFGVNQAIKLTKMDNITPNTIKALKDLGQTLESLISNLKLD